MTFLCRHQRLQTREFSIFHLLMRHSLAGAGGALPKCSTCARQALLRQPQHLWLREQHRHQHPWWRMQLAGDAGVLLPRPHLRVAAGAGAVEGAFRRLVNHGPRSHLSTQMASG